MKIKKVFNVEYDLTSEEFKAQKQDEVSEKCQAKHSDMLCKITTFCVPDKQLVVSTTEESRSLMGAADKLLAHRPLAEQSFLNMDDDMVKTFEITITADTDLEDYVTAIDLAQAKADEMFKADDSKLPLVTVVDYRWGNVPATLTATIFSDVDSDGNPIPLIGSTDSSANMVVFNLDDNKVYKKPDLNYLGNGKLSDTVRKKIFRLLDKENIIHKGNIKGFKLLELVEPVTFANENLTRDDLMHIVDFKKLKKIFDNNPDGVIVGFDDVSNETLLEYDDGVEYFNIKYPSSDRDSIAIDYTRDDNFNLLSEAIIRSTNHSGKAAHMFKIGDGEFKNFKKQTV